jgi:hypothetical protein
VSTIARDGGVSAYVACPTWAVRVEQPCTLDRAAAYVQHLGCLVLRNQSANLRLALFSWYLVGGINEGFLEGLERQPAK